MTQHVPHLTSSKDQEKLLNVLHRWPGGCRRKVSQSYLGAKARKRHWKCSGWQMRCPFWTRPGSPAELGCCKEQPHTEVSPLGRVCPALLLVHTQRCFGGLLASTDRTSKWSQQGIPPPRHFALTSHVFPVFPASSWWSCAVTGNALVCSPLLSAT